MSERTFNPKIVGVNNEVIIELPDGVYLRMPADHARRFGTRIIAAASKSEGKTGYEILIETEA